MEGWGGGRKGKRKEGGEAVSEVSTWNEQPRGRESSMRRGEHSARGCPGAPAGRVGRREEGSVVVCGRHGQTSWKEQGHRKEGTRKEARVWRSSTELRGEASPDLQTSSSTIWVWGRVCTKGVMGETG